MMNSITRPATVPMTMMCITPAEPFLVDGEAVGVIPPDTVGAELGDLLDVLARSMTEVTVRLKTPVF